MKKYLTRFFKDTPYKGFHLFFRDTDSLQIACYLIDGEKVHFRELKSRKDKILKYLDIHRYSKVSFNMMCKEYDI